MDFNVLVVDRVRGIRPTIKTPIKSVFNLPGERRVVGVVKLISFLRVVLGCLERSHVWKRISRHLSRHSSDTVVLSFGVDTNPKVRGHRGGDENIRDLRVPRSGPENP